MTCLFYVDNFLCVGPVFYEGLSDCSVTDGNIAQFACTVSNPHAKVTWYKNDEELHENDKYLILEEGNERRLLIYEIEEHDSGVYKVILDDNGRTSLATLHVEGRSIILQTIISQYIRYT